MIAPVNLHELAKALPAVARLMHAPLPHSSRGPDAGFHEPPAHGLATHDELQAELASK